MRCRSLLLVLWLLTTFFASPVHAEGDLGRCDGSPPAVERPCYGIHPGAFVEAQLWTACTVGFLFVDSDGLYFSMPAHCIKQDGDPLWFLELNEEEEGKWGENIRPPDAVTVFRHPEFVYEDGVDAPRDLALIRVEPHMHANVTSSIPYLGGATGVYSAPPDPLGEVWYYGHSIVFGLTPAQARTGFGPTWNGEAEFWFYGPSGNGDSGAPVVTEDNEAIGYITQGNLSAAGFAGVITGGVRLTYFLEVTHEYTGRELRLVLDGEDPVAVLAELQAASLNASQPGPLDEGSHWIPMASGGVLVPLMAAVILVRRRRTRTEDLQAME